MRLTHRKIGQNSAAGYYSTFRGLLKTAYRDKYLRENINDYLDKIEKKQVKLSVLRHTGLGQQNGTTNI